MASTLQILDTDETTVLFNLNVEESGAGTPSGSKTWLLHDFDLGTPPTETTIFQPSDADGGIPVKRRYGLRTVRFRIRLTNANVDNMLTDVGVMMRLLQNGCVMKWIPHGSSNTRFIDVISADVGSPFGGQALSIYQVARLLDTPEGVQVSATCQPTFRAATAAIVNPLSIPNDPADTNGKAIDVSNNGDAAAPAVLKITGDTGSKIQEVLVGVKSFATVGAQNDYLAETKFAQCQATGGGWTVALSNNTASAADAGASGGNAAECSYTTNPTVMAKRVRISRTTKLDSLRGTWDAYCRMKATVDDEHVVQLRWGPSTAEPPPHSEPEVIHDPNGAASFGYVLKKLARISIPEDVALSGAGFELWSRSEDTAARLRFDHLFFFPVDRLARITVPGGSEESWLGKNLVSPVTNPSGGTAGVVSGSSLHLDTTSDNAGTPPNTGLVWGGGRHRVTFHIRALNAATVLLRVRNITDSNDAVSQTVNVTAFPQSHSLEFDGVAAKAYQPQVDDPSATVVVIDEIIHEVLAYVSSGEAVQSNPDHAAVEKLDASGGLISDLELAGAQPLVLPPNLAVVVLNYDDVRVASQYEELNNILTRDPTVTVTYKPRYLT